MIGEWLRKGARWLLREELRELNKELGIMHRDYMELHVEHDKLRAIHKGHFQTQPAPKTDTGPAIWPLVVADIKAWLSLPDSHSLLVDIAARNKLGIARYGTPLQAHNGRDVLRDAYEEALDLTVYLRQAKEEGIEHVQQSYSNALALLWQVSHVIRTRKPKKAE